MRIVVAALSMVGAISLICSQGAGAVAFNGAALKEAISPASAVQQAYYRHHRRYMVKCYYELVVGPYRCHRYYRW